jgi:hypothetical protein
MINSDGEQDAEEKDLDIICYTHSAKKDNSEYGSGSLTRLIVKT